MHYISTMRYSAFLIYKHMRFLLLVLMLIISIKSNAQQNQLSAKEQLDTLLKIKVNPGVDVLIEKLERIKTLCIREQDVVTQATCLLYLSSFYSSTSDYLNFYRTVEECNNVVKDTSKIPIKLRISATNNYAALEKKKGNHQRANQLQLSAIEMEKSSGNRPEKLIRYYYNLALNYMTIGDYRNALITNEKS